MRKLAVLLSVAVLLAVSTDRSEARNIMGKAGISAGFGFNIPADSDYGPDKSKLETHTDFIVGAGFIYGIDRNWATDLSISYTSFRSQTPTGGVRGDFDVTNIALGGQYRFDIGQPDLTPYVGAGIDILLPDFDRHGVDNTVGIHASGGVDYFLTRQIALNAEGKFLLAPDTDINGPGGKTGNFDPSGFSGLFGVRFFFN